MKKRTVTPAQRDAMVAGATVYAPGIWADADGDLHFSVPELLAVFGWPDDAEHRALVMAAIADLVSRQMPGTEIIEVSIES